MARFRTLWYTSQQSTRYISLAASLIALLFINLYLARSITLLGRVEDFVESSTQRLHSSRFSGVLVSAFQPSQSVPSSKNVNVWNPDTRSCRGSFVTQKVRSLHSNRPLLMLRDAVVDKRHQSLTELVLNRSPEDKAPFARFALQISTGFGVAPILPPQPFSSDNHGYHYPSISIIRKDETIEKSWKAKISYVIDNPHIDEKMPYGSRCSCTCWAKRRNITVSTVGEEAKHCLGTELQFIVTLTGPPHLQSEGAFLSALNDLERNAAPLIDLSVPVTLPDSPSIIPTHLSVSLSCISGLLNPNGLPNLLPAMPSCESCSKAQGSVVVTGGAVFGRKRDSPEGCQEIASFCARMLLGSVFFDTVAVPILPKYSLAEIQGLCASQEDLSQCLSAHYEKNFEFLKAISAGVEKGLRQLEVPEYLWEKIALFPVCRLGTDYDGYEHGQDGCKWSYYHGQLTVTDTSYTLFSPYHKWYANLDLDEFVVNEKAYLQSSDEPLYRRAGNERASNVFDNYDSSPERKSPGRLQIRWLDFQTNAEQTRNVTVSVLEHGGLEFAPQAVSNTSSFNRTECTQPWKRNSGKPVVSCKYGGFGIRIHSSLGIIDSSNLSSRAPNTPASFIDDIFLYHGRRETRFGNCLWKG